MIQRMGGDRADEGRGLWYSLMTVDRVRGDKFCRDIMSHPGGDKRIVDRDITPR